MITMITDINAPELDVYARMSEPQLVHIYEPDLGLFIAESPNVIMRALDAGYEPVSFLLEERSIEGDAAPILAKCPNVPVYAASLDVLVKITGFQLTRGLLCAMRRRPDPDYADIISNARRIAILEGVVNPTNIGAIFRSAAALNVDAILLTTDCCDPLYRRSARVSMGTVFQIPWTFIDEKDWPHNIMSYLKKEGFAFVAMALDEKAVSISDESLRAESKKAILLGSEGNGLSEDTLAMCDYTVMIPMSHGVDSLNVAAASALAFWELAGK